jgi:hypothetical protein
MPGPWLSDAEITDALADVQNLAGGGDALESYWVGIVPQAHRKAYNWIAACLVGKGYTVAQLDTWDARQDYERDLSLWWCLVAGESEREGAEASARPTMVPRLLFKFDCRTELKDPDFVLLAGGVRLIPANPAAVSQVLVGPMDATKDIFQLDPYEPNPWEAGYRYRR